jgi:hypothetical protein
LLSRNGTSPSKKLAALLLVVISAGVAADYLLTRSPTTSSPSASSPQPCSSPIPKDPLASPAYEGGMYNGHQLANGTYRWLAFTMPPGGMATFCIEMSLRQANVSASELGADALSVNATLLPGSCCEYSYSRAHDINVMFDPSSLDLTSFRQSAGSLSVLYSMSAGRNATGFYDLRYPGVCGLIPLAVTEEPQRVSAANFPGFFVPSTCPVSPPFDGWSQMTGFSGMTASWVTGTAGEAP